MNTILQAGFPKSGNYWLYKIIQESHRQAGLPMKRYITSHPFYERAKSLQLSNPDQYEADVLDIDPTGCHFRVGFHLSQRVGDLEDYLANTSHVRTHSPVLQQSSVLFERFEKIVYIVRDPRDVVVSMSRYVFTPYILQSNPHDYPNPETYLEYKSADLARDWVKHVGGYLRFREQWNLHFVFYERLLEDFGVELGRLIQYLSIELDPAQIRAVKERTSFRNMRAEAPQHVRKGRRSGWVKVLTPAQIHRLNRICGPMLQILGYPMQPSEELPHHRANSLPSLPVALDISRVEAAVAPAKRSPGQILEYALRFLISPRPLPEKIRILRRRFSRLGELIWKLG